MNKPHLALSVACFAFIYIVASKIEANSNAAEKRDVHLQVACVLAKAGPTLAFTITNNTPYDIQVDELGIDPSRILITSPDGEELEFYANVGPPLTRDYRPPVVKPGESKTWDEDISRLLVGSGRFNKIGVYKLRWRVRQWVNNELKIHESNEVLLLRDKSTPAYDRTGRRIS